MGSEDMRTLPEVLEWIDEQMADSLQSLKEEPNHNSNHRATAYMAEYELLQRLREFIEE
jgi:hypothetical protein